MPAVYYAVVNVHRIMAVVIACADVVPVSRVITLLFRCLKVYSFALSRFTRIMLTMCAL